MDADRVRSRLRLAVAVLAAAALPACGQSDSIHADMVAYRPDGSLVLFSPAGIDVYDGRLKNRISHVSFPGLAEPPSSGEYMYSLSADGTVAAVAYAPEPAISLAAIGKNTRVGLYRMPDGALLNLIEIPDATPPEDARHYVANLALSPDGRLLFATTWTDDAYAGRMVDTATGAVLWTDDTSWEMPVWSADGTKLFASAADTGYGYASNPNALDASTGAYDWTKVPVGPIGMQILPASPDVAGLALVGDGTLLTGPVRNATDTTCSIVAGCQPAPTFWSPADGSMTAQLPPLPNTALYGGSPYEGAGFACNATDTCAVRLGEPSTGLSQINFMLVYRTDGTPLQQLPISNTNATGSLAISPDGKLIAVAEDLGLPAGVTVYSVDDGTIVEERR
jgi:hypothetical protein